MDPADHCRWCRVHAERVQALPRNRRVSPPGHAGTRSAGARAAAALQVHRGHGRCSKSSRAVTLARHAALVFASIVLSSSLTYLGSAFSVVAAFQQAPQVVTNPLAGDAVAIRGGAALYGARC